MTSAQRNMNQHNCNWKKIGLSRRKFSKALCASIARLSTVLLLSVRTVVIHEAATVVQAESIGKGFPHLESIYDYASVVVLFVGVVVFRLAMREMHDTFVLYTSSCYCHCYYSYYSYSYSYSYYYYYYQYHYY